MTTAFYGRYSTDLQNQNSVNDQLAECQRHFAGDARIGPIGSIFQDHALSGTTTARPGYQALLRSIQGGAVNVVELSPPPFSPSCRVVGGRSSLTVSCPLPQRSHSLLLCGRHHLGSRDNARANGQND